MDPHPSPTPKCSRTKARAGLQTEVETTTPVSFFKLYRFSTPSEVFLLCLGFTMAIIKALALPIIVVCLGEFTAMLVDRTLQVGTSSKVYILPLFGGGKTLINATREENNAELYNDSITYGILMTITSLVMFVAGTLSVDIFNLVSLRQVTRMRKRLFQSVMRQDMGWHDLATKQNFAQNMTDDIEKIHDGISENVSHFLYLVVGFITTLFVSISYGWKLTLASSLHIPIIIILNIFVARFQRILITREQESYAGAGNLAEEVLGSIRTVVAFGGQQKELERYDRLLVPARQASQRKGAFSGLSIGIVKAMLFFSCAVAFWYGVNLILNDRHKEDKEYSPQILMIALFSTFLGADNMSRVSPILESFAMARACAAYIFKVIDSQSSIDPISTEENTPTYGLRGDIEFQDVFFRYPSRLDISVHRGLSFKVKAGQTVALVGTSGCGKSTCVQLLQRFYDPVFGAVLIDGFDIRTYNIQWLRSNIAIVGQEPVLFLASIAENISYGKPQATQKEIEAAAKSAGVHDFITSLPESYQTIVGESGSQMSGGQKQRIAIARALIQNPKILLLDEATSALDYQSEKLVQDALDAASKGRTTFVVSHRLSAIRGADKIVFIHEGKTLEEGSHDELMRLEGKYHSMVRATDIKGMEPEDERCENTNDDKREIKGVEEKSLETHFNMGKYHKNSAQLDESTLRALKERKKFIDTEPEPSNLKTCVRIIRLSRPKWLFLILGSIFAVGVGCSFPASFLAVSEIFATLTEPNGAKALRRTTLLSICCFFLGVFTGFASFSQMYLFNSAGVWLTTRVRSMVFQSMFHQEIAWFDQEENAVGALSSRLTGDAACLQGAFGQPLSGLIQGFSNFGISMILSMFYSWRLALVCLSACLFIVALVIFDLSSNVALIMREKDVIKAANCIATEAIVNIRTIAGLRREATVIERFNGEIDKAEVLIRQKLKYRGLINAGGQAIFFFFYAVGACYGGVLTSEGKMPFQDIIKVADTLLYGSIHLGYSLFFLPAFIDALVAGHRVFQIIDRKPKIALPRKIDKNSLSKEINLFEGVRFTDIEFRYPTRTDVKILDGFNLDVLQGKTVALVGHSGSGKSTCIQLLQRFYDPDSGSIHINHDDLQADLSLEALRSKLGIVSQEPSLFERTIAENIAYGDNSRDVAMGEIIEAAKNANAHSFIVSLPNGYNTRLGSRGTQLSGGQKQRIAIARALVRNPKVLLLDEATSALDLQSEQIVQKALDVACSGRTCIVIAHRLSTVQNADLICVLQNGRIEEFGNHHQLIAKDGIYAKLYKTKRDINLKRFSMTSMSINK